MFIFLLFYMFLCEFENYFKTITNTKIAFLGFNFVQISRKPIY